MTNHRGPPLSRSERALELLEQTGILVNPDLPDDILGVPAEAARHPNPINQWRDRLRAFVLPRMSALKIPECPGDCYLHDDARVAYCWGFLGEDATREATMSDPAQALREKFEQIPWDNYNYNDPASVKALIAQYSFAQSALVFSLPQGGNPMIAYSGSPDQAAELIAAHAPVGHTFRPVVAAAQNGGVSAGGNWVPRAAQAPVQQAAPVQMAPPAAITPTLPGTAPVQQVAPPMQQQVVAPAAGAPAFGMAQPAGMPRMGQPPFGAAPQMGMAQPGTTPQPGMQPQAGIPQQMGMTQPGMLPQPTGMVAPSGFAPQVGLPGAVPPPAGLPTAPPAGAVPIAGGQPPAPPAAPAAAAKTGKAKAAAPAVDLSTLTAWMGELPKGIPAGKVLAAIGDEVSEANKRLEALTATIAGQTQALAGLQQLQQTLSQKVDFACWALGVQVAISTNLSQQPEFQAAMLSQDPLALLQFVYTSLRRMYGGNG